MSGHEAAIGSGTEFKRVVSSLLLLVVLPVLAVPPAIAQEPGDYQVLAWNDLGMHCMDADFSVFVILPPYNNIHAQVIDGRGRLLDQPGSIGLTYVGMADPSGSLNTTSAGKTNFWEYVDALFGVSLPVDVGLPIPGPSFAMPRAGNTPQPMVYESGFGWFSAYGIPITPTDDFGQNNPYPLMRLTATADSTPLGRCNIVLPVSTELNCEACHGSDTLPAAMPASGWVFDANPERDFRLNILRLHDDRALSNPTFQQALTTVGYNAQGLYPTVVTDGVPILCARCHLSEALPGSGFGDIAPLTAAIHGLHAGVIDPANNLPLNEVDNITACYYCHPGSRTRCLRGVMARAVAPDGTPLIGCQDCHGSMSRVGATNRTGWLDEPNCQNCHTGTAVSNNGQIRYSSVFDASGQPRQAVDTTFATNPGVPAAGYSLYRYSTGHGGLYCEACHGSTHAEFPTFEANDNIYSLQIQGHDGTLIECLACHNSPPEEVQGGPHGLHLVGQRWVEEHGSAADNGGAIRCQACHGTDYTGTVLSHTHDSRTFNAEKYGTKTFWRGYQVGCYECHNGPSGEEGEEGEEDEENYNPFVVGASVVTAVNTEVAVILSASDPGGSPLSLRIVSQPRYGTVGLDGTTATYFPQAGYVGPDEFTFAAFNGRRESNLGRISVVVGG